MYLTPFFKKVLYTTILVIVVGAGFSVWKYLFLNNTNQKPVQIFTQNSLSTTSSQSASTTPTFDPSLPRISSTTNIIEMFRITKDTKATITKDVVLDWVIREPNTENFTATQTLAKIIIKIPEIETQDHTKMQIYGEYGYGKFLFKWLNYSIDTGEKFETWNQNYTTGILVAYDIENNTSQIISHKLEPYDNLSSTGIYDLQASKQGKYFSYQQGCWEDCYNHIFNKDLKYRYITAYFSTKDLFESNIDNIFYVNSHSSDADSFDSISKFTVAENGFVEEKIFSIFKDDNSNEPKSSNVKIIKYEKGKLFFEKSNFTWIKDSYNGEDRSHYDSQKISSVESYYYDEAADKVVKIK